MREGGAHTAAPALHERTCGAYPRKSKKCEGKQRRKGRVPLYSLETLLVIFFIPKSKKGFLGRPKSATSVEKGIIKNDA